MTAAEILFIIGLILFGTGLFISIIQDIAYRAHEWKYIDIEEFEKKVDKFNCIIMPVGIVIFMIGWWLSR